MGWDGMGWWGMLHLRSLGGVGERERERKREREREREEGRELGFIGESRVSLEQVNYIYIYIYIYILHIYIHTYTYTYICMGGWRREGRRERKR